MTPQTGSLWNLGGTLFELLEAREEAVQRLAAVQDNAAGGNYEAAAELAAIETGIQQFVAQQLRDVDGLRAPLKALEQGVAINKADAAAATNRAMILQNRYDRLKDLIKQCMVALDQAGEWKPKESRKFESARGSFTLRGNGGAQPVEITDESLIPEEYRRVVVTLSTEDWEKLKAAYQFWMARNLRTPDTNSRDAAFMVRIGERVKSEVSKSAIAEALTNPCKLCKGAGNRKMACSGQDYHVAACGGGCTESSCVECGGSGKQGVPGARLAPRGESLQIK